MFRKFWLDAILGTVFIFGLMGLFKSFTAFNVFNIFDPIGDVFEDMEITDVVFSQFRDSPVADDRLLLVNLGSVSRGELGMMLSIISKYNPAVIGIDSFFYFPKEDTVSDQMLMEGLASVDNLILASKIIPNPEDQALDSLALSWEAFNVHTTENAFVNLVTDAAEQEDLKMCREFLPKYTVRGEEVHAFAVKLASYYNPEATQRFLERDNETEVINYTGNVLDYGATRLGTKFFALDVVDVFEENFTPDLVEGKVVMFCYLGEYLGDRESLEDKFFTPINVKYVGRAYPDMYGGVVHANIISMILDENYVNKMSDSLSIIVGIIIALLNAALFSLIYKKISVWYDGTTKILQLIEISLMTIAMIWFMDYYSYKLNLGLAMIAVALMGDGLEVYYGVIKNSFTKRGRRALFKVDKL